MSTYNLKYICYETPIYDLMQAGIVPEWMYFECDLHGMYTAEDFLCEWDWEWGWDLGHGYTKAQMKILKKARKTVSDGINEYLHNPELLQLEQDRLAEDRRKKQIREDLATKLRPPFYTYEIPAIAKYTIDNNEEPYFNIFYTWLTRYKHGTRALVQMTMAGIFDGKPHSPQEIMEMSKDGSLEKEYAVTHTRSLPTLRKYTKEPCEIKGKLSYLLPSLRHKLEQYLQPYTDKTLSPTHPVWQAIMTQESTTFDPSLMSRAIRYFLNL